MNALNLFRLDGKSALVTGGGRGLGQYMAEALSEAGAKVAVCSRKREACEEVARQIEDNGGTALALSCDVTNAEDIENVVAEVEGRFGGIDVLVNNSGATWAAPAEEMPPEKFDEVMNPSAKAAGLSLREQAAHG